MAALSYNHGVLVSESTEYPSLPRYNRFGVVGIAGTAPDASNADYPLNQPTLLLASRFVSTTLGTTGTLPRAISTAIAEGCSHMIIVRVAEGASPAETRANIIGEVGSKTGAYAFQNALDLIGLRPRVLIAPGFTGQFIDDGLASVTITGAGSELTEAPAITASGGGTDPGKVLPTMTAVMGTGAESGTVVGVTIVNPGHSMTEAPTLTATGGGSEAGKTLPTFTANLGDVMNPVARALGEVAHHKAVTARAYVDGPNTTDQDAVAYRNTISNPRIMVIDPAVLQYDAATDGPIQQPGSTVFAGVRARVATEQNVSESVSNKDARSIIGVARSINYGDEANYLNERQVSTFIRRGGFRTWGSRLCATDRIWQFDSVRATADMINETIEDTLFRYVDSRLNAANLKLMLEDINAILRLTKANGDIIGGRCSIDRDRSTNEELANGRVWLSVTFEPPAIMEDIRVITHRDIAYYSILLDEVQGLLQETPLASSARV